MEDSRREEEEGDWLLNRKILIQDIRREVEVKEEEERNGSSWLLNTVYFQILHLIISICY